MKDKFPNSSLIPQYGRALRKGAIKSIVDLNKSIKIDFNFQLHDINTLTKEFGGKMPPNKISHYVIAFIKAGSGTKIIGNYNFPLEPDLAMIFSKNIIHSSKNWSLNTEGYMLTFDETLFEDFQFPISFVQLSELFKRSIKPYQKVDPKVSDKIVAIFLELKILANELEGQNRKLFILKLVELITVYNQIFAQEKTKTKARNSILDQFVGLLEADFKTHREVQYYAEKLGVHPNYLNKLVRSQLDVSVKDYIQKRTFLEAKYLLCSTDIPIKEIAFELGFSDYNYFCRQFKTNVSLSPYQYKKQNS